MSSLELNKGGVNMASDYTDAELRVFHSNFPKLMEYLGIINHLPTHELRVKASKFGSREFLKPMMDVEERRGMVQPELSLEQPRNGALEINRVWEGHSFRVLGTTENPIFCAVDVCEALELSNPSVAIQALPEDERAKRNLGRQGDTWFVTESGLYRLIFRSNKPEAERFRKWVFSEVLPAIRKTGGYQLPAAAPAPDSDLRAEVAALARRVEMLTEKSGAPALMTYALPTIHPAERVWSLVSSHLRKIRLTRWQGTARELLFVLGPDCGIKSASVLSRRLHEASFQRKANVIPLEKQRNGGRFGWIINLDLSLRND